MTTNERIKEINKITNKIKKEKNATKMTLSDFYDSYMYETLMLYATGNKDNIGDTLSQKVTQRDIEFNKFLLAKALKDELDVGTVIEYAYNNSEIIDKNKISLDDFRKRLVEQRDFPKHCEIVINNKKNYQEWINKINKSPVKILIDEYFNLRKTKEDDTKIYATPKTDIECILMKQIIEDSEKEYHEFENNLNAAIAEHIKVANYLYYDKS